MIRFSKYLWLYFLISALVLVPGAASLVFFGLRPAIDFTGGNLVEVRLVPPVSPPDLSELVAKQNLPLVGMQLTSKNTYLLRFKPLGSQENTQFEKGLAETFGQNYQVIRNESVGPILGKELLIKSVFAATLAIIGILLYIAYAFKSFKYGTAAVLALFHDLLVVVGSFSLLGYFFKIEVDTLFVTAFLTTMSFSVHDTIVVFDRIREFVKRGERLSFDQVCDRALTETMGRSLANSMTIIFMLLALVLMGGATIRWFAVALLIGTISGTYSSPFVATPILILWERKWGKLAHSGK
ncbi:MAG: protein translocase subunit SecF [Patescibacteria group bacterium]